jgi:flagellar hook-associated protein 1
MVNLSTALSIAANSLSVASAQTAVVSRNIANANDPNYARKSAVLASLSAGGSFIAGIERSADAALQRKMLEASSTSAGTDAFLSGLKQLSETTGDPDSAMSLTAFLGKFRNELQVYEADPSKPLNGDAVLGAARDVASGLNGASAAVQEVRRRADEDMTASVASINDLLKRFKAANDAIVSGDGTPADLSDQLDQRDRTLKQLSEEIGIRTVTRGRNDIAIYTDGGVTLFDKLPRAVSFQPTAVYAAGTVGRHVYVDGLPVTDTSSGMASRSGRLTGLAGLRDGTAVTYQAQLDEVARGLIEGFADSDRGVPATLPDVPGLFTAPGLASIPLSGVVAPGLAAQIRVNPLADPKQGGDPRLIRDGGFGGAAYVANTGGASGFSARIAELIGALDTRRPFDPAAGLGDDSSLVNFAANSSGWIEARRSAATAAAEMNAALSARAADALQRETGVNVDEEMSIMLELERSYQASAKLISAVDGMLADLMAVV